MAHEPLGAREAPTGVTADTLLRGRVRLYQPRKGFRSSLDPVLLAWFLRPPYGRFLEIGLGTGALSFVLLWRDSSARGVGVEISPRLARLAETGVAENGYGSRFTVAAADVRDARAWPSGAASFDLVVTNPPFRPLGRGVLPPDEERSRAHHEVTLTLSEWAAVATRALRPEGRLGVVFPADRLPELMLALSARGLETVRIRSVHPRAAEPAGRVLLEAVRSPARRTGPLVVEPPLLLHDGAGFSPEVRSWLDEGGCAAEAATTRPEAG